MASTTDSTVTSKVLQQSTPKSCKVMIVGNSHTTAIAQAISDDGILGYEVVNVASYFDPEGNRAKAVESFLAHDLDPEYIFVTFGGSEHSVLGLVEPPIPFDFVTPIDSSFDRSRTFIPYAVLYATLERRMANALANMVRIRRLYKRPTIQICSPPPFLEMDKGARLPSVFQDRLNAGDRLAPASIRRKLHYLHSQIVAFHSRQNGFVMIPPPPASMDKDGYLLRKYWNADPTHGNVDYGRLVISQIREYINAQ